MATLQEKFKKENDSLVKVYNSKIRMYQYCTPDGRSVITCKTEKALERNFKLHRNTTEN